MNDVEQVSMAVESSQSWKAPSSTCFLGVVSNTSDERRASEPWRVGQPYLLSQYCWSRKSGPNCVKWEATSVVRPMITFDCFPSFLRHFSVLSWGFGCCFSFGNSGVWSTTLKIKLASLDCEGWNKIAKYFWRVLSALQHKISFSELGSGGYWYHLAILLKR